MKTLETVNLGTLQIAEAGPNEPPFLSAASGVCWVDRRIYVVGDDQGAVGEFGLSWRDLQAALRGHSGFKLEAGRAQRILPGAYEPDADLRKKQKADFEALTVIRPRDLSRLLESPLREELLRRFPHGLLMVAGSGGAKKGKRKRSHAVVYSLDENGHLTGLPSRVSLKPLHEYLDANYVIGELNIEGMCVWGTELVLSQRGNSLDDDGKPAPNMLIRLSMEEVLRSLCTDLEIGECEVLEVLQFDIGSITVHDGVGEMSVKLDFTDVDAVAHDPERRLVFSAAAEVPEGPQKGQIAGSVIGVISAEGVITATYGFPEVIKIEGVNAEFNDALGGIDLLLVSDADDPEVPAPLLAARIPG